MRDLTGEYPILPRMVTLKTCGFPIVEREAPGYGTVLMLPPGLRRIFDDGTHVIRINSLSCAAAIPDFEGRTSGTYSLLPHRDHFGDTRSPLRYLMLSKQTPEARGATTLVMLPSAAPAVLLVEEAFFRDESFRKAAGTERSYDARFKISKRQYDRCFDASDGYEGVVSEMLPRGASPEEVVSLRLNILDYLIRGPLADEVMRDIRIQCPGVFLEESWEQGGLLIIDNARVFHARDGGAFPPLQRNFCV